MILHRSGKIEYRLCVDSVRASYTGEELGELLRHSALPDARIFFHQRTHLGFLREGQGGGRGREQGPATGAGRC